jgi:hypothetical protein
MTEQQRPRGEVDHCRHRLLKYCIGQGLDLGCGGSKIKIDSIGIDLYSPHADMNFDARILDRYPDGHFDYIFSSHLLEEIENTEATLREWLRVLKIGGNIVLYQADKDVYYPLGDPRCNVNHKHHFSVQSLLEIFKKIGGTKPVHYNIPIGHEWSFELVIKKILNEDDVTAIELNQPITSFKFMVVGGPAENYIEKCLNSIKNQDYPNWSAQVVLDPISEDKTFEKAMKFNGDKIKVHLNETRNYNIANFFKAVELLNPSDDDILIMIDADDWLSGPHVLSILKRYYEANPDLLLTHGSWRSYPNPGVPNNNYAYTEQEFQVGIRRVRWKGSHLKTFKYKLWKQLKKEDLVYENGEYYKASGDLAMMYPLLEMAGFKRIQFIPEILLIYNQETSSSDEKIHREEQLNVEQIVRTKTPYKQI